MIWYTCKGVFVDKDIQKILNILQQEREAEECE